MPPDGPMTYDDPMTQDEHGPAPAGFEAAEVEAWPMADEITSSAIRLWCEGLEDANPIYYDGEFARTTRYGAVIAPPTMTMIWTWRPEWSPNGSVVNVAESFAKFLPEFPSMPSVRSIQRHSRPLHIGERLTVVRYVPEPEPPQETARGFGRPAVRYFSLRDADHREVVSWTQHGVHLPRRHDPSRVVPTVAEEVLAQQPTLSDSTGNGLLADIEAPRPGHRLPTFELPLTLKRAMKWIAGAHDFFEGHHDREYAQATGAPDLYYAVHFFHGLFGRYATDWSGPAAVVSAMDFRSWGRCFPGETAVLNGVVTGVRTESDASYAELMVECGTERGLVYDADITLRLG